MDSGGQKGLRRARSIGGFLYLWLMIGFFSGTLLLVGPVRWIVERVRSTGGGQQFESAVMIGVILTFVGLTFYGTLRLARWLSTRSSRTRFAVPAGVTIAAVACLWAWLNPAFLAAAAGGVETSPESTVAMESGAEFHFGPYPDHERLQALKDSGFTAVVSLQHPAVLPFEPPGIEAEQNSTREIGLTFIHAPMLPWVSDNEASLARIRELAESGDGKYYVHCGLGRDRTNVVRTMLARMGATRLVDAGAEKPRSFAVREKEMERGMHREIAPDVWLVPYPNEHEFYGNMLAGQVAQVVSLLDPADAQHASWNAHMVKLFGDYAVPFMILPLDPLDEDAAAEIARRVAALPRPVVVIAPFTAPKANTEVADAFRSAWDGQRLK